MLATWAWGAIAQAQTVVSPTIAQVFNQGAVFAVAVQADGKVVIGGNFRFVNGVARNNLARLNADGSLDSSWNPDCNSSVGALAIDGAGNIYVGGSFATVGGQSRNRLAKVSSTGTVDATWNPNANGQVLALLPDGSGSLYVAGAFTNVGQQPRNRIAKLSTSGAGDADVTWDANSNNSVMSLAIDGSGVYAGGAFTTIGAASRNRIARLATTNGAADGWNPNSTGNINSIALDGSGNAYVGGIFALIASTSRNGVAKLSTTTGSADATWNPNVGGTVQVVALDGAGYLYIGGTFTLVGGQAHANMARVSTSGAGAPDASYLPDTTGGTSSGGSVLYAIALDGTGKVFAGGDFQGIGGQTRGGLGVMTTASSSADPSAAMVLNYGSVSAIAQEAGGGTIIGGYFMAMGDKTTIRLNLARFNPDYTLDAGWNPAANNAVNALALDGSGDLYVGGSFTAAGGQLRNRIAKISSSGLADATWNPNVSTASGAVNALALDGSGNVFAGGTFTTIGGQSRSNIARLSTSGAGAADATWNGNANSTVLSLAYDGTANLFVGGNFSVIGGQSRNRLGKLSATGTGAADATWNPNPSGSIFALAYDAAGTNLYIAGIFSTVGGQSRNVIAKLSGTGTGSADAVWNPAPVGTIMESLLLDGFGSLYAGGSFSSIGGQTRSSLAKLSATGTGIADSTWVANADNPILAMALDASGNLHVGGSLRTIIGQSRVGYAVVGAGTAPAAPTITSAIGGNGQIAVSFAPGFDGGSPITSYTVTCNPGGHFASGSSSPITVTGLTNGAFYTCTMTATNAQGTSEVSSTVYAHAGAPAIGVSTTESHALALDANGVVYAWGNDSYGQLGQGRQIYRTSPTQVTGLPAMTHIALNGHALGVDQFHQVWSWGDNACGGQLGPRQGAITSKPGRVLGAINMTKVAAGQCFSLALRSDGTVWGWGLVPGYGPAQGFSGDTGLRQLPGLTGIVDIAAGNTHALALRNDATLMAFGENDEGQLGLGTTGAPQSATPVPGLTSVTAIGAGNRSSLTLHANGTIRYWGRRENLAIVTSPTALPPLGGTPISVSLGGNIVHAVRNDGIPFELMADASGWNADSIAGVTRAWVSGFDFGFVADSAGQLYAAGTNESGQCGVGTNSPVPSYVTVPGFANVAMVAPSSTSQTAIALKNDGSVWFWGANTLGQSGDGAVIGSSVPLAVAIPASVRRIATGNRFSVALDIFGNVWGWGDNGQGAFGSSLVNRSTPTLVAGLSNVVDVAAGSAGLLLALQADGTVTKVGTLPLTAGSLDPAPVAGLSNIVGIAAGSSAYAIRNDGALFAWGANTFGELGNGTTTPSSTPVQVGSIIGSVIKASGATNRAYAVTNDGKAWAWGSGVLGNGTSSSSTTPVQVSGITDASDVSAGSTAVLVLRQGGGLLAWGNTGLTDSASQNILVPYPVAFHEAVKRIAMGPSSNVGFLVGNTGLAWGLGFGVGSVIKAAIGDGAYVPRDRPVVLFAPGGAGSIDGNNWYLDLEPATAESVPAGSIPKALGVSRLFGSDAGLSFDATIKYRASDYGKAVNNYVFALVPPSFLDAIQASAGVTEATRARAKMIAKDSMSFLAQLTPSGWAFVDAQLLAYSQSTANALGSAVNILNTVDATQIPGARFCIGYGETSGSMLTFEALREVLLLPGASSNLSGVPCILTGLYVDGPASSVLGASVAFKASVVGLGPTGTVRLADGPAPLGNATLLVPENQAVSDASIAIGSLALGTHSIGATYSGDSSNAPVAVQVPLVHEVLSAPAGGSATVLSGPVSSARASEVAFTAIVAGGAGTVQFKDGASNLGAAVPLASGSATLRTSALALGAHAVTAVYSGDGNNAGSTSNTLTHTVYDVLTTQVSLTSTANPAANAQAITLTATVTGNVAPTGTVYFRDAGATLSQASLVNGTTSYTASNLAPGSHQLYAEYGGDANNPAVTSPILFQDVIVPAIDPPRLVNISTRGQVQTGFDVMIGGFVLSGPTSKTVVIRAIGPSLANYGVQGALSNPQITLVRSADQSIVASNDNWGDAANAADLNRSGFAPANPLEAALYVTLAPGAYTAIVSGVGGATGVGLVEVYEVDHLEVALINISTRGKVQTGFDVMIGGFVIQGSGPQTVVVRAIGPSLTNYGVQGALVNPQLTLVRSTDQAIVAANDDWGSAGNAAQIQSSGFAPSNPLESAIYITLDPGAYTAIVNGVANGTGVGLVEVYKVGP